MRKILGLFKKAEGFTLIELLVVIGILGILAAALIATIDPFEQLKKAQDSKIKNMVVEFQNANVRYFTTHNAFPWTDTGSTNANCTALGGASFTNALSTAGMRACLGTSTTTGSLIGEGELKAAFISNTNDLQQVSVTWVSTSAQNLIVCFAPTSRSQKASSETIYTVSGGNPPAGTCPNANAPDNTCYWCTR